MASTKSYGYKQPSYGYMQPGQAAPSSGARRLAVSLSPQAAQANASPSSKLVFPPLASATKQSLNYDTFNPIGPTTPGGFAGPSAPAAPAPPAAPVAPLPPPAAPTTDPVAAALSQVAPGGEYDFNTDPVLQQIKQLGTKSRSDAASGALALRKQLAIRYGDTNYARNVLGDEQTAAAAAQNPFAIPRQLETAYSSGLKQLEDSFNKGNLWYSGARATGLQDAANQYQGQLADVTGQQQSALAQIAEQLLMAQTAADQADQQAAQTAQAQRLALVLANQPQAPADSGGGTTAPPPAGGAEPPPYYPPYNPPPTGPPPGGPTEPPPPPAPRGTGVNVPGTIGTYGPFTSEFGTNPVGAMLGLGGQTPFTAPVYGPLMSEFGTNPKKAAPKKSVDLARLLGGFRG